MSFWDTLGKIGAAVNPVGLIANAPAIWGAKKGIDAIGGGKGAPQGPSDLDKLINYAEGTKAENQQFLKDNVGPQVDLLGGAGQAANFSDQLGDMGRYDTLGAYDSSLGAYKFGLGSMLPGYGAEMSGYNNADQAALGNYTGAMDQRIAGLGNLSWQDAQSAGEGLDAQRNALSQYQGLTTPGVTAQERLMAEQARRASEQQERASRDAVMTDMAARGVRGSGAELTNMLGSQQLTGQNRVLADMAMNANAVDRSMQALRGYADTAGQMRSSEDVISMFNAQQGQAAKQWQEDQAAKYEADKLKGVTDTNKADSDRADQAFKTRANTLAGIANADTQIYGARNKFYDDKDAYTQRQYDRQKDRTGAAMDYGGLFTGSNRADSAGVMQGMQFKAGTNAANAAAKKLEDDGFGIGPFKLNF